MKAILLGSSGFWRELEVHDYPPVLRIPLWKPANLFYAGDAPASIGETGYDTATFHRVAISEELQGAPRLVVYLQEAPK